MHGDIIRIVKPPTSYSLVKALLGIPCEVEAIAPLTSSGLEPNRSPHPRRVASGIPMAFRLRSARRWTAGKQASKQGENNGGWAGRGQRGVEKPVALGKSLLPVEVSSASKSRPARRRPAPLARSGGPIAHAARIAACLTDSSSDSMQSTMPTPWVSSTPCTDRPEPPQGLALDGGMHGP